MNKVQCRTCRYFDLFDYWKKQPQRESSHAGHCRRHAPVTIQSGENAAETHWPCVQASDQCGDYEEMQDGGQEKEAGADAPGNVA